MRNRWYVGHTRTGLIAFKCPTTPTVNSHGDKFIAVVGPFKTKRAAKWAERYGKGNPHFRHVDDAERLAM